MRKSSDRTPNYRSAGSPHAMRLASFRKQMADFARAERFRELRERRHLSQEDAAHEIGVSVKTVRSWEKGGGIRWTNAKSAAKFYGVDPEGLVSREPGNGEVVPIRPDEPSDELSEIRLGLADVLDWIAEQSEAASEAASTAGGNQQRVRDEASLAAAARARADRLRGDEAAS